MFEVGFTELLLIFALALIVLGPRRLPELASRVGHWVGRARAMARQLREQLDQEVSLEQNPERSASGGPKAAATAPAMHDNDDVDPQGQPCYPPDHHSSRSVSEPPGDHGAAPGGTPDCAGADPEPPSTTEQAVNERPGT